ncbi:hypothetical protein OPQ81_007258 [Rhizoctonia solani]|nr:hypothetical protein OPQ81_007258 [Rhizoctonia solani]
MSPLETHELASLAPANGNGLYENHDARISKISIHERNSSDDEGSDDGNEGESASAALLGGHARSDSLGATDPPIGSSQVIKRIISETAPTLFLTVLGMMFTGALLQRVTHWKPMRAVDELFILIPMLNNLKGNLELVLSARLATASHIGVLDRRSSRRTLICGSLSLLQLQALCVSALAATVSFLLGLALPDTAVAGGSTGEKVSGDVKSTRRWHIGKVVRELVKQAPHKAQKIKDEGTKSGWRELIIVLATAMSSASLSGLVLGSFMCSIVLLCRRFKLDPDNIAPPIASCLGDLVTLTLTALTSTLFFYTSGRPRDPSTLSTPQNITSALPIRDIPPAPAPSPSPAYFPFLPFLATLGLIVLIPFVFQLCRRLTFSRPLIRDGWSPLVLAMAIESGTGLVLDWYVGRYRGFGMLAVVTTSLPGSVGAVFVSRLSTELHQSETNPSNKSRGGGSPKLVSFTLFAVGFPVLLSYLVFVWSAGWLPLPVGFVGLFIAMFSITVAAALALAYYLTHLFWRYGFDPDAYCLPVHNLGRDVKIPSFSPLCKYVTIIKRPALLRPESSTITCPQPPPTRHNQVGVYTSVSHPNPPIYRPPQFPVNMSGWMSYFTGKKDSRQTARDAIVNTRQHLAVLDKKEENLQRKIEEELKKAKANAVNNKAAATAALRRKKVHEAELEKLYGQRMTLETQLNAIENANLNAETMAAMRQGAQALRDIHGNLTIDKVDATMDQVREQMELTEEISQAISNPLNVGVDLDEDDLKNELAELEQEELNDRLMGADRVPLHTPAVATGPSMVSAGRSKAEEEDAEERELRELQAALAS